MENAHAHDAAARSLLRQGGVSGAGAAHHRRRVRAGRQGAEEEARAAQGRSRAARIRASIRCALRRSSRASRTSSVSTRSARPRRSSCRSRSETSSSAMTTPRGEQGSLWSALEAGNFGGRFLGGASGTVRLAELRAGTSLGGAIAIAARALGAARDDGSARGGARHHRARRRRAAHGAVSARRAAFAPRRDRRDGGGRSVVSDHTDNAAPGLRVVPCGPTLAPATIERRASETTEWILLTSGTTGVPKLVVHDLASLAGPDARRQTRRSGARSTTSAAMAACRFSCARCSAAARWCCRAPRRRRRISSRAPAATASRTSPARRRIGAAR